MIPHNRALVIVRSNNKGRWLRPAVVDRIRAKQVENVTKMQAVHRAAVRSEVAGALVQAIEEA